MLEALVEQVGAGVVVDVAVEQGCDQLLEQIVVGEEEGLDLHAHQDQLGLVVEFGAYEMVLVVVQNLPQTDYFNDSVQELFDEIDGTVFDLDG